MLALNTSLLLGRIGSTLYDFQVIFTLLAESTGGEESPLLCMIIVPWCMQHTHSMVSC